ncbi:FtsW/RodA/SpoVE family cell cycle protein [Leucobacter sp. UT-8R-CII-1-4]|uniref:FtsW/RodA/SpoVE family cell cycle protein n=1 Tax=Leucobacter sp. UT-8R-CII-1-4 TaxID=3040075 RepID=UPI0024A9F5D6|nr:FtsW/RodA/SpoVE family cell cycle protein [Leucobacter sp. UT-8R-CII-1-4]MDI6024248.1 FtsW/RodA/SpoVE family cell cycle protein [Leucobacter sp. UT-8R-CII-1-4]
MTTAGGDTEESRGNRLRVWSLPSVQSAQSWVLSLGRGPLRALTLALIAIVLLLVGIGIIMVQSASQVVAVANGEFPIEAMLRQGAYAALGLAGLVVFARLSTARLRKLSWLLLFLGLCLQLLVYSPLGYEAGGNRNWLRLGPVSMQPAEFMKLVLLLWVSSVIAAKKPLMTKWLHVWLPILPVVALSMFINVLGGDLGTLMVLAVLVFGCLYFSQIRLRILAGIALVAALGIAVMTMIKPNRVFRVLHFMEVDCLTNREHANDMCWQSLNGFWALAGGGVFGVGVGNSKAKWSWLPEAETDFIFAIIGEELGLIGTISVIALYVALIVVLLALMGRCVMPFSISVLGGLTAWIGAQMMINIAVVLGYVPVLGVPLPFISAGGTSLVSLLLAVGAALACIREEAKYSGRSDDSVQPLGSAVMTE